MASPLYSFPTVDPQGGIAAEGGPQNFRPMNPEPFGGNLARTEEQAGQNLEQGGADLGKIVLAKAQMSNELMANDAQTDFMKKATALYGDYQQQEGKGAQAALPGFQNQLDALRQQSLAAMPNDQAKLMLDRGTRYYTERVLVQAQAHANEQFWAWHDASAADAAAEFGNQAALATDPAARQTFLDAGVNELVKLGERHGLSPDEMQSRIRKYKGGVLGQVIEQQALDGDAQGAAALLHDYRGQMDAASVLDLERKLQPMLQDDSARTIALSLTGRGPTPASYGDSGFNNNVGNLRYSQAPWQGKGAPHNGFETFATPEAGVAAAIKNLAGYGDVTLEEAIYRWAPPSENNTEAYVERLAKATGISRDAPLPLHSVDKMAAFMKEMTRIEKGRVDFSDAAFRAGAAAAIEGKPLPPDPAPALARAPGVQPNTNIPGDTALPDEGEVYKRALAATDGNPKLQAKVLAQVSHIYEQDRIVNESARRETLQQVTELTAKAENGVPDLVFPEEQVRALFPPDKAQALADEFNVANTAGTIYAGMKWMAPEEMQSAYENFVSQPDHYQMRQQLADRFQKIAEQRQRALFGTPGTGEGADPAGYVRDNQLVKTALQGVNWNDPASVQRYGTTILDVQGHIGVPRANQHILTAADAKNMAATLQQPNADVKGTLDAMRTTWGNYYPQVLGDLQTLGKLPPGYAVAEAMADPQARAAAFDAFRTPAKELKAAIPEPDRKEIDKRIEDTSSQLATLGGTFGYAAGGMATFGQIKDAVRSTAYRLYSLNGADPSKAADQAINAVTGQKYDFIDSSRARVPKGMADAVETGADLAMRRLSPDDMALSVPPATLEQLRADPEADARLRRTRLREVQLGHWVTNENDNGIYRVDSYGNPVMLSSPRWRAGRQRMEVFFDSLPQQTPAEQAQAKAIDLPASMMPAQGPQFMRGQ